MFNINTLKLYFYIFNNTKMLAEYMQKIESLISPNNYSRENFKQKIIETSKNNDEQYTFEPDDILKKTSKDSIENLMSTNEQINKLKKENEGKLELPEEIVIKHQDSIKSEGVPPRHFKIKNREYTEKDIQLLLEKVHGLNLKNMNYRYEIEKYKTQLNESIKEKNNYKLEIEKLEKQKENLTKYLLKLEENLSNSQKTNEGVPIINFMLDGKSYTLSVDKTQPINVFDFITCAYGKASVPSQFEFYRDENMTDKIELVDFSYKECDLSFWNSYTIYVKSHQLASVKFCLHDINGCATSFNAHILTDELLTAELFQNLYREYYNDKAFTLSKAVFYSDKNLTNQIYYATNETQNTIHVDYSIVSNE